MKRMGTFLTGMVIGGMLAAGMTAYAAGVLAERSFTPFFLNGAPVAVDAYLINENNYFKLRDIAALADFGVTWDAQTGAVYIDTTVGYTPEEQTQKPTVEQQTEATDYSAQANPAVFTGTYTREVYNALRGAILTGAGEVKNATEGDKTALMAAEAAAYVYPAYDVSGIKIADHAIKVTVRHPATFEEGAKVCKAYLASLSGSSRDKLTAMAAYVCDRLEYDAASTTTPRNLFTEPGVHKGACMSYALGFKFLCDLEGIPCVFVHSEDHQWNEVLVDGTWYAVDLANYDLSYTRGTPGTLLKDPASLKWDPYVQIEPELTRFAKELVAPGSTK